MINRVKIFIFCLIFLFSGQVLCKEKNVGNKVNTLPTTPFYDLNGREFDLEKLEGNVLLIHFWATWCSSCVDGLKSLNKLQKLLRKEPIIIVPISEDFKGAEVVKSFYNKFNLKFIPAFIDRNNKWFREMKVSVLPTSFIINSEGKNVMKITGKIDWLDEKNISLIRKYIAAKEPYNPDYVALINEHSVKTDNNSKKDVEQQNNRNEQILRSIETNLAPVIEDDKLKNGEINMSNISKNDFKTRRAVNAEYNNHIRDKKKR